MTVLAIGLVLSVPPPSESVSKKFIVTSAALDPSIFAQIIELTFNTLLVAQVNIPVVVVVFKRTPVVLPYMDDTLTMFGAAMS